MKIESQIMASLEFSSTSSISRQSACYGLWAIQGLLKWHMDGAGLYKLWSSGKFLYI